MALWEKSKEAEQSELPQAICQHCCRGTRLIHLQHSRWASCSLCLPCLAERIATETPANSLVNRIFWNILLQALVSAEVNEQVRVKKVFI